MSFFAFQDIITALAGTLLILVLAAVYERGSAPPPDGRRTIPASKYQTLQKQIALSQTELQKQRSALADLRKALHPKSDLQHEKTRKFRLRQDLQQLEKLSTQRKNQLAQLQRDLAEIRQQNENQPDAAQRSKLINELEKYNSRLAHQQNLLQLQATPGKQNLLLDCARGRWVWQEKNLPGILLGKDSVSPEKALRELYLKLRSHDHSAIRLIIAVRPSAGGFINALIEKLKADFPQLEIAAEPLLYENTGGLQL